LVDAPPVLIEHLLTATGASEDAPRATTADEIDAVLQHLGLGLKLLAHWRRLEGPRLDRWLANRPGDLLAQRLVLLAEEHGREGAHWVVVAGLVATHSLTEGAWIEADDLNREWRIKQVWTLTRA
jgi:hypothetical protein